MSDLAFQENPPTIPAPMPAVPAQSVARGEEKVTWKIAQKMYGKMPVPHGVVRVPWERLDASAMNLWYLLAKAAIEALNETEI